MSSNEYEHIWGKKLNYIAQFYPFKSFIRDANLLGKIEKLHV